MSDFEPRFEAVEQKLDEVLSRLDALERETDSMNLEVETQPICERIKEDLEPELEQIRAAVRTVHKNTKVLHERLATKSG